MLHISCKAGAQALVDVISGQLPMAFVIHTQTLPHMRSGVEGIVADIDDIVKKVRFPDWQHTTQDKGWCRRNFERLCSGTGCIPTRICLTVPTRISNSITEPVPSNLFLCGIEMAPCGTPILTAIRPLF